MTPDYPLMLIAAAQKDGDYARALWRNHLYEQRGIYNAIEEGDDE